MYKPKGHDSQGSQPEVYLPPSSSADARERRGRAFVLGSVAVGVVAAASLAGVALSGGDESAPNTSPVPSASAKPFTPTPEATTLAASASTTESALPSSTPSTTEAAVVPT